VGTGKRGMRGNKVIKINKPNKVGEKNPKSAMVSINRVQF
jgi:hypothetical protein